MSSDSAEGPSPSDVPAQNGRRFADQRAALSAWWDDLPANTRGAVWMLIAGLAFTSMATTVKLLGSHLDSFQMAFFRCFFGFMVIWPLIFRAGIRNTFRTDIPLFHLGRSLVGTTAMGLFFYALPRVPLADLTAISFAKPLFMIFLAVLFLNEVIRWRRWTATAIGFVGVVVMVRPGSHDFDPTVLIALMGTLLVAVAVVFVKKMSARETTLTMLAYFGALSSVLMAIPALITWQWPTPLEWVLLVFIGAMGCLGQSFLIRAYRIGEATAIAPFDYSRLLFAALAGFIAFGEVPDEWTLVGAATVIGSTFYIANREARRGQRHRDPNEALVRKV